MELCNCVLMYLYNRLYVSVCMCVCVCMCVYVCMCVCMYEKILVPYRTVIKPDCAREALKIHVILCVFFWKIFRDLKIISISTFAKVF